MLQPALVDPTSAIAFFNPASAPFVNSV